MEENKKMAKLLSTKKCKSSQLGDQMKVNLLNKQDDREVLLLEYGSQVLRFLQDVAVQTYEAQSVRFKELISVENPYMPLFKIVCSMSSKFVHAKYPTMMIMRDYICGDLTQKCPICYSLYSNCKEHVRKC